MDAVFGEGASYQYLYCLWALKRRFVEERIEEEEEMEEEEIERSLLRNSSFGFSYGSFGTLPTQQQPPPSPPTSSESTKKGGVFGWLKRSDKKTGQSSAQYEPVSTQED